MLPGSFMSTRSGGLCSRMWVGVLLALVTRTWLSQSSPFIRRCSKTKLWARMVASIEARSVMRPMLLVAAFLWNKSVGSILAESYMKKLLSAMRRWPCAIRSATNGAHAVSSTLSLPYSIRYSQSGSLSMCRSRSSNFFPTHWLSVISVWCPWLSASRRSLWLLTAV